MLKLSLSLPHEVCHARAHNHNIEISSLSRHFERKREELENRKLNLLRREKTGKTGNRTLMPVTADYCVCGRLIGLDFVQRYRKNGKILIQRITKVAGVICDCVLNFSLEMTEI